MHDFNAAIMLVTLLESYLMLECMKYALKYRIKDMEIFLWFFFSTIYHYFDAAADADDDAC